MFAVTSFNFQKKSINTQSPDRSKTLSFQGAQDKFVKSNAGNTMEVIKTLSQRAEQLITKKATEKEILKEFNKILDEMKKVKKNIKDDSDMFENLDEYHVGLNFLSGSLKDLPYDSRPGSIEKLIESVDTRLEYVCQGLRLEQIELARSIESNIYKLFPDHQENDLGKLKTGLLKKLERNFDVSYLCD